jgi:four helix bundle protein
MNHHDLRKRTKDFAIRIVRLVASLPSGRCGDVFGRQIMKSGTSIGANYREALRASSKKHFTSIIEIATREADETLYWLELLAESNTMKPARLEDLMQECRELVAILAATARTAKRHSRTAVNPTS